MGRSPTRSMGRTVVSAFKVGCVAGLGQFRGRELAGAEFKGFRILCWVLRASDLYAGLHAAVGWHSRGKQRPYHLTMILQPASILMSLTAV